jgi:hypothetical protein
MSSMAIYRPIRYDDPLLQCGATVRLPLPTPITSDKVLFQMFIYRFGHLKHVQFLAAENWL